MDDKVVKTVSGLAGSVATFVRQRDKARIYVFPKRGESIESAITRVKQRNGSTNVEHQIVKQ